MKDEEIIKLYLTKSENAIYEIDYYNIFDGFYWNYGL